MKIQTIARIVSAGMLVLPLLSQTAPQMTVYKTRTCGCCSLWIEHLKGNGFNVAVQEVDSTAEYEKRYGVPRQLQSCHTAVVNGYAIEGHVPAREIHRLLKEKPSAKGLAVPGMPMGSPGMEGSRKEAYSVMLFDAQGRSSVYQRYP